MSMTPQQARDAIKKYGGARPAARALGVAYSGLWRKAKQADAPAPKVSQPVKCSAQTAQPAKAKTLAEFRATYDKATIIPSKLKAALAKLGSGGWEYEVEFAKLAGVSLYDLGRVREQFADYTVSVNHGGKRVWAGSKALANQMREMV